MKKLILISITLLLVQFHGMAQLVSGDFQASNFSSFGGYSIATAIDDFDNDGTNDIAVANLVCLNISID